MSDGMRRAHGMALVLALLLVMVFAAMSVALTVLTTHQADRTRGARDAAQLRSMLVVGQRAADRFMPLWRVEDHDKRIVIELPAPLQQHGGKLTMTVTDRAGGIQRQVSIRADFRGRSAVQQILYGLADRRWTVLRADFGESSEKL